MLPAGWVGGGRGREWAVSADSTSHRARPRIESLGQGDYYNPSRYWFIDRKGLRGEPAMGLAHGCSMFTRRAFDLVGGHPHISGTQDLEMDKRLRAHPQVTVADRPELRRPDWYCVYGGA